MKKVLNIFLCFFCVITAIFALALTVIEGRLLFAGDWLIYDNALNGFVRYALRFILSLITLLGVVSEMINLKKKNQTLSVLLFFLYAGLFLSSILICIFATNYVGLVCIILSSALLVIKGATLFLINQN